MVRRPDASSAPATRVRTWAKVGRVNAAAKGCSTRKSKGDGRTGLIRHLPAGGTAILSPISQHLSKRAKVESTVTATRGEHVRIVANSDEPRLQENSTIVDTCGRWRAVVPLIRKQLLSVSVCEITTPTQATALGCAWRKHPSRELIFKGLRTALDAYGSKAVNSKTAGCRFDSCPTCPVSPRFI